MPFAPPNLLILLETLGSNPTLSARFQITNEYAGLVIWLLFLTDSVTIFDRFRLLKIVKSLDSQYLDSGEFHGKSHRNAVHPHHHYTGRSPTASPFTYPRVA